MNNGLAVDFTHGYLSFGPPQTGLVTPASFAYTCWALHTGGDGCIGGMGGDVFGVTNSYVNIVIFGGTLQLFANDNSSANIGSGVFPAGWTFVALVANAGSVTAYVGNSAAMVSRTLTGVVTAGTNNQFTISNTAETDGDWAGSLAGHKLWNQPLSQVEVFREARQRAPVRKQGLVSYHPMWSPDSASLDQVSKSSTLWTTTGTFGAAPSNPPIREYLTRPHQWSLPAAGAVTARPSNVIFDSMDF